MLGRGLPEPRLFSVLLLRSILQLLTLLFRILFRLPPLGGIRGGVRNSSEQHMQQQPLYTNAFWGLCCPKSLHEP
jgi:hypothetical protein